MSRKWKYYKTSENIAWTNMKQRCYNPNHKDYPYYGGKNIEVCDRWWYSFENFLEDMGPKPRSVCEREEKLKMFHRKLYRLVLDENGEDNIADFMQMDDAIDAFNKAVRRKTVFSARIDVYDYETQELLNARCKHFEAVT